jgi:hypothetical protein
MKYEVTVALQELDRLDNKCKDWYLLSLKKDNKEDKDVCMAYYHKYDKERSVMITRLGELTEEWK